MSNEIPVKKMSMIHGIALPEHLVVQAREMASGEREAAVPRNAATVVLFRDSGAAPEVYLLRRHVGMEFAAGFCVFPGGGIDPYDASFPDELWAGPSAAEWATRMGCTPDEARSLVCAAVRETFEETGVLFAGTVDDVVPDTTGDDWEADREALVARETSLTEVLKRRGLVMRTDLLSVLGAWLTPIFEPKRYRTWFFVAALPPGQRTRDVSTESDAVLWSTVADAVKAVDDQDMFMLPPTYCTLLELYDAATPEQARDLAAAVPHELVEPYATERDGDTILAIPPRFGELFERVHG